jgi:amino acid transporter
VTQADGTEAAGTTAHGLFARNATGLVRGVSPRAGLVINFIPGHPAQTLTAVLFFWTFVFPQASWPLAAILVVPMTLSFSYAFGLLTQMIPRSGGDYMLVSRVMHPALGLVSSFCMCLAQLLSNAFFGIALVTVGLAPGLTIVGLVGDWPTLVSWGATLSSSHNWQMFLGSICMVLGGLVIAGNWRYTVRFQAILFWCVTGVLLVCGVVALILGHTSFVHDFNSFGADHHAAGAYQSTIASAKHAGQSLNPPKDFRNTIPMLAALATVSIYSYWATFVGGELRQASTIRTANMMALGGVGGLVMVLIFGLIFQHTFGISFLNAANGGHLPPSIAVANAPFFYLTSAALNNVLFAIVMVAGYIVFWPLITSIAMLQPTRMIFAYAFDGILPRSVTKVSRGGSPYVALVITILGSIAILAWAIYVTTSFFQVLVYATLIQLIAMGLVGIAAIIVPWVKPDLYRASTSQKSFLGIPLVTIAGVGSVVTAIIIWIIFFSYNVQFGLANKTTFAVWAVVTCALALAFYAGARFVRRSQGVDIDLAYAEIPPE